MLTINEKLFERVKAKIELEEGSENKMYRCPAGFNTIGIGHNLAANPISDNAIDVIFRDDLSNVVRELDEYFPWWVNAPEDVRVVLMDLTFNMGMPTLRKFKNTMKMIERGEYMRASYALLNSRYAKQVKNRANRNAVMLRNAKG
jgi:lysozyme